jgi:hypothetical protein
MRSKESVALSEDELAQYHQQLRRLARYGYNAYQHFFITDEGQDPIGDLLQSLSNHQVLLIIDVNDFFFPWELLYPVKPADDFDYQQFWGFQYIIYRRSVFGQSSTPVPQQILCEGAQLGLIADDTLSHAVREREFFRQAMIDDLLLDCELDATRKDDLLQPEGDIYLFLQQKLHTIHFACRSNLPDEANGGSADQYCFSLTPDFLLCPSEIAETRVTFANWPLLFLNTCSSSNTAARPGDSRVWPVWNSIETYLRIHKPACIITTEGFVPDIFAGYFTEKFYPRLWETFRPGLALLATRQLFLNTYHNPLGLLYSLHAANPPVQFVFDEEQERKLS